MKTPKLPKIEKEFKKLKEVIQISKTFFLAGHLNPDGDTIGSMLAFHSMLSRMDKKIYLFSQDPVPDNLSFLRHSKCIKNRLPAKINKIDAAILLECSTPDRAGNIKEVLSKSKTIVNIDHHKTAKIYGDINIIDHYSSSTAEIIYRFFYDIKLKVNKLEASYLYTGIVTDTGRFHFPSTGPRTHEIASRLLETGFDFSRINDLIYSKKAYESIKLMGRAFESLKIINGNISTMTLELKDFKDLNASNEHSENIINYGMMIPSIKVSVLFKEEESNKISVTFRSKGNIDVSKIAYKFSGGGHKHASGCKLNTDLNTAKEIVIRDLIPLIK